MSLKSTRNSSGENTGFNTIQRYLWQINIESMNYTSSSDDWLFLMISTTSHNNEMC